MSSILRTFIYLAALFLLSSSAVFAGEDDKFSTSPRLNDNKKWRVGYYEGGPYENYYNYLKSTVEGLMILGWIEKDQVPEANISDTKSLWEWLTNKARSKHIEFVRDAYYSAQWDKELRTWLKSEIIHRLKQKKDIDLMIAMGTWAGKDLATREHSTPTYVLSTSDAVKSGIIKSVEDSGLDHVNARVDPKRYERQVRVFHDVIGFKKLGVAYENSEFGRSYAAIDDVQKVARERGFEVIECHTQSDIPDRNKAGETVIACFQELAKKADSIYVTVQNGVNADTIPKLVQIANTHRIPTFSQAGSDDVKKGMLLSISRGNFRPVGMFQAATMAKIFNGASPRRLNQLFEESPKLAINLKTAEVLGIYLYADVLAAADEIYQEIENNGSEAK